MPGCSCCRRAGAARRRSPWCSEARREGRLMARRKRTGPAVGELVSALEGRLQPPFGIVLGSPREAAEVAAALRACLTAANGNALTCYQMDVYQGERLTRELEERGVSGRVFTAADLWDLPEPVQTLVYPIPEGGERLLKLDMLEQSFHAL